MLRIRDAIFCLVSAAFFCSAWAALPPASGPARATVDFVDYFIQSDDHDDSWTLGGIDVRPARDPDGTKTQTYVLNKFSNPGCYEVFKVTDTQVQIRYEVVRMAGKGGTGNWIRRFEEIEGDSPARGAVWLPRFIVPGGDGYLSLFRQDRFIYDPAARSYAIDRAGSVEQMPSYLSAEWATVEWGKNNHTGFALHQVLRVIAQWQREGMIFETYDYARGKGLVGWRWLERVSTLRPKEDDASGRIFHCEEGFVEIKSMRDGARRPVVFHYDATTATRGRQLEVIAFTSHWRKDLGDQWYVVYRDLTKERPLEKKAERIAHDVTLPEWTAKPGATVRDLPHLYTHPPQ